MKPKFQVLNCLDTELFICTITIIDLSKDIRNDSYVRFDTSDYSDERINLLLLIYIYIFDQYH